MNIYQFKKDFFLALSGIYPETEVQSFFKILVEFRLDMNSIELALQPNYEINTEDLFFLINALSDLVKQKPIQYIIGQTTFYSLLFDVNKHVLIPRSETEELVAWIIEDCQQIKNLKILDIGTGSGCIAISLAKNLPETKVYAIDISPEALGVAQKNATKNNADIHFIEADILVLKKLSQSFDIIVSNPPYVRELEKAQMQQNVLANEPHLALFVKDDNPLLFYERIAEFAKSNLITKGCLYIEINQYLGIKTVELLQRKGFKNIRLKKDLYGVDRMVKASLAVSR